VAKSRNRQLGPSATTSAETSPSHFSKLFKISTGPAPHQFVLQERIDRAKILIRQSNAKIVWLGAYDPRRLCAVQSGKVRCYGEGVFGRAVGLL